MPSLLTGVDELTPLRKQLPFVVFFIVAATMSSAIATLTVSDWTALAAGAVLTAAATGLAALATAGAGTLCHHCAFPGFPRGRSPAARHR